MDDPEGRFVEAEWLQKGKKYNFPALPTFVTDAKNEVFKIPPEAIPHKILPSHNLSVNMFTSIPLPRVSSELISTKPKSWFSTDTPLTDPSVLQSRSIPPSEFIHRLKKSSGQAWMDGAKSIIDPRYNDGADRLPLWTLTFWVDAVDCDSLQSQWKNAITWLDREDLKPKGGPSPAILVKVHNVLGSLPSNAEMKYFSKFARTNHLSYFLSTHWLNDEHIDMMVDTLNEDLEKVMGRQKPSVAIANVHFCVNIQNAAHQKASLPDSQKTRTPLYKWEVAVKENGLKRLYFPLHINGNHWIAGLIEFEERRITFGDSLKTLGDGFGAPAKFVDQLQVWFKNAFGKRFKNHGNILPHSTQDDSHSCPIITMNTIAHHIFDRPLWESGTHATNERLGWFLDLAASYTSSQNKTSNSTSITPTSSTRRVKNLLNPFPDSIPQSSDNPSLPAAPESSWEGSESERDTCDFSGDSDSDTKPLTSNSKTDKTNESTTTTNKIQSKLHTFFNLKRARSRSFDSGNEGPSQSKPQSSSKPPKKRRLLGDGTSRSAVASRKLRQALKKEDFTPDPQKYQAWKDKITATDANVEFDPSLCTRARHSICGKFVVVREPYDFGRWNDHIKDCKLAIEEGRCEVSAPSLWSLGWGTKKSKIDQMPESNATEDQPIAVKNKMFPCPGITEADHPNVVRYLNRTSVQGGGARSLVSISKDLFQKTFSALKSEKSRKRVVDTQAHEQTWRNDHGSHRVYSTSCERQLFVDRTSNQQRPEPCSACRALLQSRAFRNATRRPVPPTKNFIYVNKRFQNSVVGEIYASNIGVKELVQDETAKTSPFVRYALGAVKGDYDNQVFNGLLQAMVTKHDKEERNVGPQNFFYAPAWEEMCHILRIHSSRAYKSLREYLPMPSERNLRKKEARQPRFPMDICDQTFELVADHLETLNYNGPVSLSCDDTKLFATFRLYWDGNLKSYFLVGGTSGPIRVADPESVRDVIEQAKVDKSQEKATKVRVWCITTAAPGITPVIAAAIPITSLDAPALLRLLQKVIDGLLKKGIAIVSYACDGTEVERNVQRLFLDKTSKIFYSIPNPRPGGTPTTITYGKYESQVICMIQDSKHALKTMRNNLFSGARLLTFGNFVAIYRHIAQITGDGSPLYSRDTTKVDRQDDNAAVRLFSAAVLQYLASNYPDCTGEIVYLFVFGELIDAYQNRSMDHRERIKLVLRARYFLDSWELYLSSCGYRKDHYFISREANDILRIIIEGLIALVIIHRDHISGPTALLPWLHSSEACEHVFGEARFVVKDFTFLDFIYMIPKLRIKLHEAVLRGKSGNGKACASGYNHTYFDNEGLDLAVLSSFPTDAEIQAVAHEAAQEADSLIALLGVDSGMLHRRRPGPAIWLPSVSSWLDNEVGEDLESEGADLDIGCDESDSDLDTPCEAEQLQELVEAEEDSPISRSEKLDKICLSLTSAALAVAADETSAVRQFAIVEDDELENVISAEYVEVQNTTTTLFSVPPLRCPDEASRPLGHGSLHHADLDFQTLIKMRMKHQTKHATFGVRTSRNSHSRSKSETNTDTDTDTDTDAKINKETVRGRIIRKFHEALKEAQDERGVNTGRERSARWTERVPAPGGRGGIISGEGTSELLGGNSANAAVTAAAAANQASKARKALFVKSNVPNLPELVEARVTIHRPIQIGDFGFVYTTNGIMIGKVVTLYSKTGGKNAKHAPVTESSNISAVSYMGVQLFQFTVAGRQFSPVTDSTAIFRTHEYQMLPSLHFLCLITTKIITSPSAPSFELSSPDLTRFRTLCTGMDQIAAAMKLSRKRGGGQLPSSDS